MGDPCTEFRLLLPEHNAGVLAAPLRDRLDAHLKTCRGCQEEFQVIHAALHALESAKPSKITDGQRTESIQRAIRAAQLASPVPRRRGWGIAAGGLALAAAALLAFLRMGPGKSDSEASLASGGVTMNGARVPEGEAIPMGATVEAIGAEVARINLEDGSSVSLAPQGRITLERETGYVVTLESGAATFQVAPQEGGRTFRVHTPEIQVRVIGTRFRVQHTTGDGSEVRVESGVVEVRLRSSNEWMRLRRGEAHQSRDQGYRDLPGGTDASGETPEEAAPATGSDSVMAAEEEVEPEVPGGETGSHAQGAPTARQIRRRLRAGEVGPARVLLREARRRRGLSRSGRAELAVLGVEADLAERRHAVAIEGYLDVHRRYGGTAQAETALFAAAQLALDHVGRARGVSLAQRYLRNYPQGRYGDEARSLIQALSAESNDP